MTAISARFAASDLSAIQFIVSLHGGLQLPTVSAPPMMPSTMSARRDNPRHMTMLLGGGSLARAR